jgi:alpha-1,2-mannosyltransferase
MRQRGGENKQLSYSSPIRPQLSSPERLEDFSSEPPNQSPFWFFIFPLFFFAGLLSAFYNVAFDCDEIYNYWEPMHYLMYKFGFQTWEYSPVYGLRSYLYLWFHVLIGHLFSLIAPSKSFVFYGVKLGLGTTCAFCQTYFLSGVYSRFGLHVSIFTLLFLLFSPGMFISSTSFLPSSFAMYCLLIAFGSWFQKKYFITILSCACSVLIGWPFVLLLILPIAIDTLIQCRLKSVLWALISLLIFIPPILLVDWYYYQKIVFAPLNIVLYNFFSQTEGGSALYGVEPPSFYFINSFLNFNIVFLLALGVIPISLLFRRWSGSLQRRVRGKELAVYFLPMYIWFSFMTFYLDHKEERFLFVIYPLYCLAAAVTLVILLSVLGVITSTQVQRHKKEAVSKFVLRIIITLICVVFIGLSLSRIVSLHTNYRAPFDVYKHLEKNELQPIANDKMRANEEVNICVGKEWYRFTSNFFIPEERFRMRFLKSGFGGQLPKPFESHNGTSIIPTDMNSFNREEVSRYVDSNICHYIVELEEDGEQFQWSEKDWEKIFQVPFLAAKRSKAFFRAFYVPKLTQQYISFDSYVLLRRKESNK